MIQSNNFAYTTIKYRKTADYFPGVVLSLNNNECSNKYLSANVSVHTAALCGNNLLCTTYK